MAIQQTLQLQRILQDAADHGDATGILLVPDEPVSFRSRDGIERTDGDALTAEQILDIATAALGEKGLARVGAEAGQAMTSCGLPGIVDGRLCVSRTLGRHSIAIRILPRGDLTGLARRSGVPRAVIDAASAPAGLVLVTGSADGGKTTTEYALLDEINASRACHICTMEYMIGMYLPAKKAIVQQREIGVDVPDCISGIQASIAQNLDVLMVGELRQVEELEACIRVAAFGHLVITQLHVATAQGAIARVVELVDKATREQFARSLRVVVAQHLLPRADGEGQIAVFGVIVPDNQIRRAIIDGQDVLQRDEPLPPGCQSLGDDIDRLVSDGTVTDAAAREVRARFE